MGGFPWVHSPRFVGKGSTAACWTCWLGCRAMPPRARRFWAFRGKLADTMDSDHVATLALAHWPSAVSPWYDDLRRIARLSPVLGKFMLLDDYFSHTDMPGRLARFEPDEYRTPYLKQAIVRRQSDPISQLVQAIGASRVRRVQTISALHDFVAGKTTTAEACESSLSTAVAALRRTAACASASAASPLAGYLVVNSLSFARRIGVEVPNLQHSPLVQPPVALTATRAIAVCRGRRACHGLRLGRARTFRALPRVPSRSRTTTSAQ